VTRKELTKFWKWSRMCSGCNVKYILSKICFIKWTHRCKQKQGQKWNYTIST